MIPLSNLKLTENLKWSITIHTKAYTRLVKQDLNNIYASYTDNIYWL